ncbi:MAG: RagB/SusD family nutrient uptake outer membrane protein [Firmicutes bacterium]|nr:RagB/SusD family nutrient uptake outer membrane protein [Bacillota bacterium]MCM1401966.1 RagB/SusD family nutrient uptake outer membrane protein [Bacteroides sp.]MCM1477804.1 RagB/SusD family nutrient uptake outer membrane protein [Bacteroides sp.]
MKKKYFIPLLALAASMSFSSCSDFLTEDPKGQLTPSGFFTSQKALDAAVNALYYNVQQSQCNSNPGIPQCQGDDITSTTGSNKAAYLSADAFEAPSDAKGVEFLWKWQYNIIQAANLVIDNAPGMTSATGVTQESIDIAMGNAYFWRAYAYFNLVRVFGPLPVNMHNVPDNNQTVPSSVEEIYNLIVEDLLAAEKCNLPAKYTGANQVRGNMNIFISEQAVKSALAAVYMNMAGYPMNKTEYYAQAAAKAKEVVDGVNSGKYPNGLCADWKDVYSYGNNYSKEAIVGITYRDQTGGWSNFDSQMSSCHQFGSLSGGWGDFLPERYYWSLFPEGPRKDYVFAKKLRTNNGVCVDWWATTDGKKYDGTNAVVTEYRPMFVAFTVNTNGSPVAAPYDYAAPFWGGMCINKTHQIIRYSEVICWFAEAAARSGNYVSEAQTELQKVMARAYNTVPAITDLADAAFKEHGYEVAGMPFAMVTRRADEFRLNILKEAFDYRKGKQTSVLVPAGTVTQSMDASGNAFTYTTTEDVVLPENMAVTGEWHGENSIYQIYPPKEVEKNPNLKR